MGHERGGQACQHWSQDGSHRDTGLGTVDTLQQPLLSQDLEGRSQERSVECGEQGVVEELPPPSLRRPVHIPGVGDGVEASLRP